jgi:hypothetical protein
MVRMTRFAGRRSLRVAELHFALSPAGLAVQFLESTGHEPDAGAATQDVRASLGLPSVGAPGQEKSWRPQPQTTVYGEKGSGVSLL